MAYYWSYLVCSVVAVLEVLEGLDVLSATLSCRIFDRFFRGQGYEAIAKQFPVKVFLVVNALNHAFADIVVKILDCDMPILLDQHSLLVRLRQTRSH